MGRKAVSFLFYGISVVLTGLLLVAAVLCRYASSVSPGEGGFWATLALLMPALLGVLLAVVQFVPEMAQKRLKLTLHLPFPQWKMILLMSGIGLGALALLFIVQTAVLWGYFHALLAPELVARILLTALPWYLAGLTLYLLTAWICLEPTWKRRLANLLIAVGVCRIFFLSDTPQAYDGMLSWLALLLVCSLFFPLLSVYRFKQGCQD